MENEPTLEQIDDYNDNESPEKRRTIKLVILFLIVVSVVYGLFKFSYNSVDEYVGTPDKPGINTTKN
ncbi:MAG: hypothetical protein U9R37_03185 [Campylobacterota bacterium]|nr:hypothetical protein [Campylobacterota bacterium]